jgi:hypothetical protein
MFGRFSALDRDKPLQPAFATSYPAYGFDNTPQFLRVDQNYTLYNAV